MLLSWHRTLLFQARLWHTHTHTPTILSLAPARPKTSLRGDNEFPKKSERDRLDVRYREMRPLIGGREITLNSAWLPHSLPVTNNVVLKVARGIVPIVLTLHPALSLSLYIYTYLYICTCVDTNALRLWPVAMIIDVCWWQNNYTLGDKFYILLCASTEPQAAARSAIKSWRWHLRHPDWSCSINTQMTILIVWDFITCCQSWSILLWASVHCWGNTT